MTDPVELYREVQIDLSNAHFYGISWREISRDVGVSPNTVKKFAEGATKRPSFQTVLLLAEYAGHKVTIGRERFVSHGTQTGKVLQMKGRRQ